MSGVFIQCPKCEGKNLLTCDRCMNRGFVEIDRVYVVFFYQSWAESPVGGVKAVFTNQDDAERFADQDSDYEVDEVLLNHEG